MIELEISFLPQRMEGTKWADKKMLTRWECKIIGSVIPFTCFAPTTHAEILYGCPWPTNEITVTKQEGTPDHISEYLVSDPKIYDCIEEAMAAAKTFRDEISTFIKLWRNNYTGMNYKIKL